MGLGVSGGLVVLLWAFVGPADFGRNSMQVVPFLAVPLATLLGAQYGPAIARSSYFDSRRVTLFAVEGVLLGDAAFVLFAYASGQWRGSGGPIEAIGEAAFMFVLGVLFFGIPFLVLSWPFVALWAVVTRNLLRIRARSAGPMD